MSALLAACAVGLVIAPSGDAGNCRFSERDCALLAHAHELANSVLDSLDDEDEEASAAERRADRLTKEGSTIAARAAWRDAARARIAGRLSLEGYRIAAERYLRLFEDGTFFGDREAQALANKQFRALASYLGQQVELWDRRIAQALARVRTPQPAAASGAKEQAVARAGEAAQASAAAVGAAVGPGRHPWPQVTDDAGLRDLWAQLGAENAAVVAGFDRLVKGLTGPLSVAERNTRADAMALLLGGYRDTWKVMLTRLKGAKGLTVYAGCRSRMIDHANGLRVRDGLIVRLIRAVRKGDAAGVQRALAAQRAQGAKDRQLAAKVRACLKAAGPPSAAPPGSGPGDIPVRLDLSSLCPGSVERLGVRLVKVDGPQADYRFNCHYALPTNKAVVPVTVSIIWWTPTSGRTAAVGNCAQGVDRISGSQIREWASGTFYLDVQGAGGFDDRDEILKKILEDAEKRNFALRCSYKG